MSAEVIPFGDFQLCQCGTAVASFPIAGGLVCSACFDEFELARKCASCASTMLRDPGPASTLDDLLAKLVSS